MFITLNFSVPSKPPSDVRGKYFNTTALGFYWNSVPDNHKNGIILGYQWIFFSSSGTVLKSGNITDIKLSHEFLGLQLWTNYSFMIRAYTVKGYGPWSALITQATDEAGGNSALNAETDFIVGNTRLFSCWNLLSTMYICFKGAMSQRFCCFGSIFC